MTKVATTLRSAYLAGPMRGYDEYNFPAFHKATAKLRADGWIIESPAERDEADESIRNKDEAGWADGLGLDYFMRFDLEMVCRLDSVICLPNWEQSQGARLETVVAVEVGHPVFEYVPGRFGKYELKSVDPEYVRIVFFGQGIPDSNVGGCQAEGGCSCDAEPEAEEEFEEIPPEVAEGIARLLAKPPVFVSNDPTFPTMQEEDESWATLMADQVIIGGEIPTKDGVLPLNTVARKGLPVASGVVDYFPAALVEVARVSKAGNDKHNPGQPLHHARGKSTDHADALMRHLIDRGGVDAETGMRHSAEMAWRALALLQQELEDAGLAPLARGAREEVTE